MPAGRSPTANRCHLGAGCRATFRRLARSPGNCGPPTGVHRRGRSGGTPPRHVQRSRSRRRAYRSDRGGWPRARENVGSVASARPGPASNQGCAPRPDAAPWCSCRVSHRGIASDGCSKLPPEFIASPIRGSSLVRLRENSDRGFFWPFRHAGRRGHARVRTMAPSALRKVTRVIERKARRDQSLSSVLADRSSRSKLSVKYRPCFPRFSKARTV
jgi:hypothetical protein